MSRSTRDYFERSKTVDCNWDVQAWTTSSSDQERELQREWEMFDRFTKGVVMEEGGDVIVTCQMSSRGGEAPGAAASGRGRQPAASRGFGIAPAESGRGVNERAKLWFDPF